MIVNFKIFESNYKFMDPNDEEEFKEYITPHIIDYFDKKIPKLKLDNFVSSDFGYRRIIDDYIFDMFFFKTMYSYVRKNISDARAPEVHNTFTKILDNFITDSILKGQDSNIYTKIENRLVEIFEKNPNLYKDNYNFYGDELSATVKDKLKYILDSEKYNL